MPWKPKALDRRRGLDRLRRDHPASGRRGYGSAVGAGGESWRVLAERKKATQPFCSVCGTGEDLTVDHVDPTKRAGLTLDDLDVLCRAHNSKKGG